MKKMLISIVKDPLCHLLIISAVIYGLTQPIQTTENPREIRITQAFIDQLEQQFHHTYLRHPTPEEQQKLIDQAVMDLALYREGLQNNLDQADEVVKRRVIQKMNFIIEGMAKPGSPEMADLALFLEQNPKQFQLPKRYSFEHRFFGGHSSASQRQAEIMLAALHAEENRKNKKSGEYFLRGHRFHSLDAAGIDNIFGGGFAERIAGKPEDQWLGPFPSTYGWHLVRISEITPSRIPELTEVRDRVYAAWKKAQTEESVARIKRKLLDRYQVNIIEDATQKMAEKQVESEQHVALN